MTGTTPSIDNSFQQYAPSTSGELFAVEAAQRSGQQGEQLRRAVVFHAPRGRRSRASSSPGRGGSRSSRMCAKRSTTSTWLTTSSSRPRQLSMAMWLGGSTRAPMRLLVRRTPLATARTLPCSLVNEAHDAVGLAEADGAQHDALVAVQRHFVRPLVAVRRRRSQKCQRQ